MKFSIAALTLSGILSTIASYQEDTLLRAPFNLPPGLSSTILSASLVPEAKPLNLPRPYCLAALITFCSLAESLAILAVAILGLNGFIVDGITASPLDSAYKPVLVIYLSPPARPPPKRPLSPLLFDLISENTLPKALVTLPTMLPTLPLTLSLILPTVGKCSAIRSTVVFNGPNTFSFKNLPKSSNVLRA